MSVVAKLFGELGLDSAKLSQAFINGEWVSPKLNHTFAVLNPATGEELTKVANCTTEDAEIAIEAAKTAFEDWGFKKTAKQRGEVLYRWFQLMVKHRETLGTLLTLEQGKPLGQGIGEIDYASSFFEYYAEEARRVYGEIVPSGQLDRQHLHFREPAGVVALITPWNFPSGMITRKGGAAIAAGCTCVVKPAEDTPLCALAIAALATEAGVPKGVFNVLPSNRENTAKIGKLLCESTKIDVISFTGSTAVGKILLSQSASTVKKICLELGGNASFIVFESADLDAAVEGLMGAKFPVSGQKCTCANRIFVQSAVYDEFLAKFTQAVKRLNVGDGMKKEVTLGPLINERGVEKVERLVSDATARGAKVEIGGKRHAAGKTFFEATILTGVTETMEIHNTEIFGPVAPIYKFETEEEVLKRANNTRMGLTSYFYSRDVSQIFGVSRRLEVGMIGVNEVAMAAESAFGGVKESGLGREGNHHGIDEFTEWKYVVLGGLTA